MSLKNLEEKCNNLEKLNGGMTKFKQLSKLRDFVIRIGKRLKTKKT